MSDDKLNNDKRDLEKQSNQNPGGDKSGSRQSDYGISRDANANHALSRTPDEPDDYDDGYDDYDLISERVYTKKNPLGQRSYLANDEDIDLYEEDAEYTEERDYRPIRMRRDGKLGCLGGLMYSLFIISTSIVLACVAWMAACDVLALNKPELNAIVDIPLSAIVGQKEVDGVMLNVIDIDEVSRALKDAGIIEYRSLFKLFARISNADTKIKPGSYNLSTVFDYRALVKKMQTASEAQLTTKITIPEGYTLKQIFEALEENEICTADDLWDAAANKDYSQFTFLNDPKIVKGDKLRFEGFMFPDTYEFYQGEQASSVILKFLSTFHYKLTADMLAQAEGLGITMREAVIVASMIEREAANIEKEGKIIASVIYNRLRANMPLGIDATIQYALPEHKPVLSYADLEIDSPYNTYKNTGLPVGPISNPGIASINAALQPDSTNYYYYALDTATGEHRFFRTSSEHQAFIATQNYG